MPPPFPEFIILATIVRPHGTVGQVKAEISFHNPDKLPSFKKVWIQEKPFNIAESVVRNRFWYVSFEGIDSIEKAECLRNQSILVSSSDLEPLPENTFYHFELVGFKVQKANHEPIGTVKDILSHSAVDSLVIENGETKIIPLSESIIEKIDKENRLVLLKRDVCL